MSSSLRERQLASLKAMLNLNTSTEQLVDVSEPVWKILVFDKVGQDILAPLISVKELRENGVTLHIPLNAVHTPIPDVPAIYFTLPTDENVEKISKDIESKLYGSFYLNFINPITRSKIEDIANAAIQSSDLKVVQKVFDQYCDFICLEEDFFVATGEGGSFQELNSTRAQDTEITQTLEALTNTLFSALVQLQQIPIIRAPRNTAASMIAESLDKKLREHLRDTRNCLFTASYSRPLLLIYDRILDLPTCLAHSWNYQSLVHDLLGITKNQVKLEEGGGMGAGAVKTYDLDGRRDTFWDGLRSAPFNQVAEAIQNELEEVKRAEDEVRRLKIEIGGVEELNEDLSGNTNRLSNAIKDLPALLEKKKMLDQHMNIATALLSKIKSRHLDNLYEMETKLLQNPSQSILGLQGGPKDKIRLFLMYYILNQGQIASSEVDQFQTSLGSVSSEDSSGNIGSDPQTLFRNAFEYVKKWISLSKMSTSNAYSTYGGGVPTGNLINLQDDRTNIFSKIVGGTSYLMEGVRNLVFKKQALPLTRIVQELMDGQQSELTSDYVHFDPKQLKQSSSSRNSQTFSEAVVFVVGGGNYHEYNNINDVLCKKNSGGANQAVTKQKKITYGTSCLLNGEEFLDQLSKLGEEA